MAADTLQSLFYDTLHNPHHILGIHYFDEQHAVIRLWRPGAHQLFFELNGNIVQAKKIGDAGLFEHIVPRHTALQDYRVYHQNGILAHDPYAFMPTFGEIDQYLFANSVHYELHKKMGARLATHQGIEGVQFTVWAPSAVSVSLVADFNHWDGRVYPMRSLGGCGVWELFVPGIKAGEKYKFEIRSEIGDLYVKADPYALASELRPHTASVVADCTSYEWHDRAWMQKRLQQTVDRPISIYEVHLGSWKKRGGHFMNYKDRAHEIAEYCVYMGFTHVELLPISEHPLDESWGYQVSGFFAVTSRFGTPRDFQYFVDHMHQKGIGVIIDWVPGHFPQDSFSLARFDGTCLYEHEDPRQGMHPHWGTHIFNFSRKEVSSFLIASALLWLDFYHIDGLRVDAVASMLYLDYGREGGEWIPNRYGGKENLDAIEFLKHANAIIHERFPGVLTIAEESTSFAGVTHPVAHNGLGFDMKWNMGWMNDTLRYFEKDPIYRKYHHHDLTFGLLYAFSEKFTLVLSHDEVVHGKKSLLAKMPGDMWQQFANLRLLIGYMMCYPGKKLLFMGADVGQWNEWWSGGEQEWYMLDFPLHKGCQTCIRDLNHLYTQEPALWGIDFSYHGFDWVDFHDTQNSIISFKRKAPHLRPYEEILCVMNFTPQYHSEYIFHLSGITDIEEILNTDAQEYGGSGKVQGHREILYAPDGRSWGIKIAIAPLACMLFRVRF